MEQQIIKLIVNTLLTRGAFSISDLESALNCSRSLISKTLKRLTENKSLKATSSAGPDVKYFLADNQTGLDLIFTNRDNLLVEELARACDVSLQTAKKRLNSYVDSGLLIKHGQAPQKIIYEPAPKISVKLTDEQTEALEKYYAYVSPGGKLMKGVVGFLYWAEKKSGRRDFIALAQEYLDTRKKYYNNQEKVFLIDATEKVNQVFGDKASLKKLFHRDFDALPVFGKTYLSRMISIAKSGRYNAEVINYIYENIKDSLAKIISDYKIEAIAFIPPTVKRQTQILDSLSKKLRFNLPVINLHKVSGLVPVQQKSLKNIEDRIFNANQTIAVAETREHYNRVLIIDDVTGSGATLNETASKLLDKNISAEVYAFTITGSAKANDFDVISEA